MFYRNENETSIPNDNKPSGSNTQYTQPIGDNINSIDYSMYDNEPFQCPFDMDRLSTDGDPRPHQHHPMPPHHQHPSPYPYQPNVYYIIHHHHHFYHNRRPSDGGY